MRSLEERALAVLIIEGESPLLACVERLIGVIVPEGSLCGDICCHWLVCGMSCCLDTLRGLLHGHLVATKKVVRLVLNSILLHISSLRTVVLLEAIHLYIATLHHAISASVLQRCWWVPRAVG